MDEVCRDVDPEVSAAVEEDFCTITFGTVSNSEPVLDDECPGNATSLRREAGFEMLTRLEVEDLRGLFQLVGRASPVCGSSALKKMGSSGRKTAVLCGAGGGGTLLARVEARLMTEPPVEERRLWRRPRRLDDGCGWGLALRLATGELSAERISSILPLFW